MTAQGYLKLCLCYDKGIDLRQILRGEETGQNEKNIQKALNEKLTTAMRAAIYKKPAAHFEHTVAVGKNGADILSTFEYVEQVLHKS